jgi:hypothetical protein
LPGGDHQADLPAVIGFESALVTAGKAVGHEESQFGTSLQTYDTDYGAGE